MIQISTIPQFLKNSEFYESLNNDDNIIDIPDNCYTDNIEIKNHTDLYNKVCTVNFWNVYDQEMYFKIYTYCRNNYKTLTKPLKLYCSKCEIQLLNDLYYYVTNKFDFSIIFQKEQSINFIKWYESLNGYLTNDQIGNMIFLNCNLEKFSSSHLIISMGKLFMKYDGDYFSCIILDRIIRNGNYFMLDILKSLYNLSFDCYYFMKISIDHFDNKNAYDKLCEYFRNDKFIKNWSLIQHWNRRVQELMANIVAIGPQKKLVV